MEGIQRVGPLAAIPTILRQFDQDPAKVIASAGLMTNVLEDAENTISFLDLGRLLRACVTATKCSHFGLLVGRRSGAMDLGFVGQLMCNAPTLGRAVLDWCVNQQRYVRGSVVYLSIQGEDAYWGYGIYHPGMEVIEQACDIAMAMGLNIFRDLSGVSPRQVRLARHKPENVEPYRQVFGQMPVFEAEQNVLVFSSKLLKCAVGMNNPQIRIQLEKALVNYWAVTQPSITEQVVRVLRVRSVCGNGELSDVAKELGLHEKSLYRELHHEGTCFRDLRSRARFEIARQLLAGTDISVTNIAMALGYAETSDFSRAFHTWSGQAPSAWRTTAVNHYPEICPQKTRLGCSRYGMVH